MNDLHDHLTRIAGSAPAPGPAQLDADLVRGKRALRRRRTLQTAGGSAFAVAAVVAAVSFTASGGGTGSTPGAPVAAPPAATSTQAPAVKLVAYKGKQPEGFTVDKVPDGWFIQNSNLSSLVLAPKDRSKTPTEFGTGPDGKPFKPSVAPIDDPDSFVGKITVFLQSRDQHGTPEGKKVDVAGAEGVLQNMEGDDSKTLWIAQGKKPSVLIQFWEGIGLTEAQMIELGAGVHVEKGAVQGAG
ncbi:hypothetical protein [Symbioplanes lichenis]|uniref:hypothetical protein n=1 Tax=Symbioplanes lichenis TaxID=1629072 RepID=UPI002738445E|nr:hypothetical protein [Actinoplanes lichenis]